MEDIEIRSDEEKLQETDIQIGEPSQIMESHTQEMETELNDEKKKKVKPAKPDNLAKLKASSLTAIAILKVLSIICAIFMVLFIAIGIYLVIKNPDLLETFAKFSAIKTKIQSIVSGNVLLNSFSKDGLTGFAFGVFSIGYGVYLLILLICMLLMSKVFSDFATEITPFNKRTIRCLKGVFIVISISAIYLNIAFGIFAAFVLWCVIKIFRYGLELQLAQESH